MILYHPYDDIYHCFFRLILLISKLEQREYALKTIQILDFYFLFPSLLKNITLPKEFSLNRTYINQFSSPYSNINDPKKMIVHLEHQIRSVTHHLAAYSMLDVEKLKKDIVLVQNKNIYENIIGEIKEYDNSLLCFLVDTVAKIPLNGPKGLKARTNLFEYRYDNV
jgi:hypothetical protein